MLAQCPSILSSMAYRKSSRGKECVFLEVPENNLYRTNKEKMDEAIVVLRKLEQCWVNQEFFGEIFKNEVADYASELNDIEEDIKKFQAKLDEIVISEIKDIPFTSYSMSSPNYAPESLIERTCQSMNTDQCSARWSMCSRGSPRGTRRQLPKT